MSRAGAKPGPVVRLFGAELHLVDPATRLYELAVDDIPQSQVSLADPTILVFDYIRHIARLIDAWAPAAEPLRVVHLGGGALTLARYLSVARPGSDQLVVDNERQRTEAVLEALPLPEGNRVRMLYADARAAAVAATADLTADVPATPSATADDPATLSATQRWPRADVTVVDLWQAAKVTAHVASLEFYSLVRDLSATDGLIVVNLLDGPGFVFSRGQAATLAALFPHVALIIDSWMLDNTEVGNTLIVASNRSLDLLTDDPAPRDTSTLRARMRRRDFTPTWIAGDENPPLVVTGARLVRWLDGIPVVTDASAADSPPPDEAHFADFLGKPLLD